MKRKEGMSSVLDAVRVIDFGQYIAGPLTAMLLADQGADVIRVDPPGGPLWDTPANATWNRGKRRITLHLKQPDDQEGLTDIDRLMGDPQVRAAHLRRARELFKTRTAQDWEDLVARAGSECAVCRTSAEWFGHPHARASQMVLEVNDPRYGAMLQPGINVRLSRTPGAVRRPAPLTDQHRAEILTEAEVPARPVPPTQFVSTIRAALAGVRVLDLCIILAGPPCGRMLAEFGADVIKIDNPTRGGYVSSHNDVNRGKRSLLLDLRSAAGREVFWRLLADADVVVQNYRAGKLAKLGLSYEDVRQRKPDIIYASLNAFGHVGPWAERPGHEQFAQAMTGMQCRFGGDGPPMLQPNPINDYGTGFMSAYAAALALLHHRRTGEGQHVDTALAYTAMIHQSPFMQVYTGKRWDEPSGQDRRGSGPLHRAYRARDGWFCIGACQEDAPPLAAVDGLASRRSMGRLWSRPWRPTLAGILWLTGSSA